MSCQLRHNITFIPFWMHQIPFLTYFFDGSFFTLFTMSALDFSSLGISSNNSITLSLVSYVEKHGTITNCKHREQFIKVFGILMLYFRVFNIIFYFVAINFK